MKVILAVVASVFLVGCQKVEDRAEVADVNARNALLQISKLESRVTGLEETAVRQDPAIAAPRHASLGGLRNAEDAYMLVGPVTLAETGDRYPSKQSCDAARAASVQHVLERAESLRAQGMVTDGEPQISCVHLT